MEEAGWIASYLNRSGGEKAFLRLIIAKFPVSPLNIF